MKKGIDLAAEMVVHAMPLNYNPTIPLYTESFEDESGYDPTLASFSNQEKLAFVNDSAKDLESEAIKLSGIFSNGSTTTAMINTRSKNTQYFQMSDAQATVVLAHANLKWEVQAEQSCSSKADLDASALHDELSFLLDRYQHDSPVQLPLGTYNVVFGPAATADLLSFMNWIGFSGGSMKRGFSFLSEEHIGKKVFSSKFNLGDDPTRKETFPFQRDFTGIVRKPYPLFTGGIFQGFVWYQDDADEFGANPTGHTVSHRSLFLHGGEKDVQSLRELVALPRDKDTLYIPFLHYMNIVNPSRGIVTGSSRFGTLFLKKDGSVAIPFNVRITQSLLDIFGDKVAWMSGEVVAYNTSSSYGARNPTAIIVPKFMEVEGLEISHSNSSY